MMIVKGTRYRTNLPGTMQLRVMRKVQASFGVGWGTACAFVQDIPEDAPLGDVMGDDRFQAWVWGWVLNAGTDMTLEQLGELTPDDILFVPNDEPADEPDDDAVPTSAPTGSGRGAANRPRKAAPAKAAPAKAAQRRQRSTTT